MKMSLWEVSRDRWPRLCVDPTRVTVWENPRFLVQAFSEKDGMVRLSINRKAKRLDQFAEGISWDELQAIKAACGYADRDAVEAYPPADDVVNVANMRHLWIYPEGVRLPFVWRRPRASQQLSLVRELLTNNKGKDDV